MTHSVMFSLPLDGFPDGGGDVGNTHFPYKVLVAASAGLSASAGHVMSTPCIVWLLVVAASAGLSASAGHVMSTPCIV